MASTFVLLTVLQLLAAGHCITTGDNTAADITREVKDTDTDKVEDDLDTEETGWLYNPIQEKVRALEYLKSKVLSPLVTLQSPSTFYGGSYPVYSANGGGGLSSSFTYGSRYPYYSSNGYKNNYYSGYYRPGYIPLKNKFNLYSSSYPSRSMPVYSPKVWYNKGYYGGSSSYAPGCTYPTVKPSYTYIPTATYTSSGTPLSYHYSPPSSYGVPSTSFSAKASFGTGFGVKSYVAPQYFSNAGQSSGYYFSPPSLPEGFPSYSGIPLTGAIPPLNPTLPSPPENPYGIHAPNFPSTTPSTPVNPPNDFLVKAVIFPHRASDDTQSSGVGSYAPPIPSLTEGHPSIPTIPYAPTTPPLPTAPQIPYSPPLPSYSSFSSAFPPAPALPAAVSNFPNTVSNELPSKPPYGSFESVPFKPTLRQDYNAFLSNIQGIDNGNREVIITPAPPKAKINLITALPGSSIGISPDYYPYQPNPGYAVPYYPNVFYISNQQNNERPSTAGVSETSVDSQSAQPISTDESTATSTDSTPSSESSTAISSQRSSRPIITSFYSSNTIDQTRIPLFYTAEQYSVPSGGVYYSSPVNSNVPSGLSYTYGTPVAASPLLEQVTKTSSNINAYPGHYTSLGPTTQPLSATTASPPC